jgi:hypothetical protein
MLMLVAPFLLRTAFSSIPSAASTAARDTTIPIDGLLAAAGLLAVANRSRSETTSPMPMLD